MIVKEKILDRRSATRRERATRVLKSSEPDSAIPKERMFKSKLMCLKYDPNVLRHILQAARNPIEIDDYQANAVAARIELDLRIGAAFTRLTTLQLQPMGGILGQKRVISYGKHESCSFVEKSSLTLANTGSCQFPTLGFVVDRYFRVKNFKPETFWSIKISYVRDDVTVNFLWRRVHLFDRAVVVVLFERCLDAKTAKVTKVQKKPTSKWRPLPLTTVDLQMMGSRYLRMDSNAVMKVFMLLLTCL